jgi:hypothetical protein
MSQRQIDAFERRLRMFIGLGRMDKAERLIRAMATHLAERDVLAALDRPLSSFAIEGWETIEAEMEDARRSLPEERQSDPWQAVLVGLRNHSGVDSPRIQIGFTLDGTPEDVTRFLLKPEDQYQRERWIRERATQVTLPGEPHHHSPQFLPGLALTGLDDMFALENAYLQATSLDEERWCRLRLPAAVILLRFHQTVERYSVDPGLPSAMQLFAYVEHVDWPMETNTYEFSTRATRLLSACGNRFDHATTKRVLESRRAAEAEQFRNETIRRVCELRELREALQLWPVWLRPFSRSFFADHVALTFKLTRDALQRMHGIDASYASDDELYRLYATARHPGEIVDLMTPLRPNDRSELHQMKIAFAKRFGGRKVRARFLEHPDRPAILDDLG